MRDDLKAPRPDTVLFDLGGVLVDWSPRYLYEKVFRNRPNEMDWFLTHVCNGAWNVRHDAGQSFPDNVAALAAEHPWYRAEIEAFWLRWPETMKGPIQASVDLLEALHARDTPLFALTNWSAETFPYARANYPFLQYFRDIVVSGEIKLIKPDAAIYHASLGRVRAHLPDIQPAEVVFIDDVAGNAEAAIALGWQGIHHVSAGQTRGRLRELGVSL